MIGATTLHGLLAQNVAAVEMGFGYLYNYYAAIDANMFPTNCALPTNDELQELTQFVSYYTGGGDMKEQGLLHWDSPNTGAVDTYGFAARGAGQRSSLGIFANLKKLFSMWGYDSFNTDYEYYCHYDTNEFDSGSTDKKSGNSIRCIYTGSANTVTDYDGNVYDVVTIGNQKWLAQNWKCTHLNNGTAISKVTDNAAWANLTTAALCAYDNDENNV